MVGWTLYRALPDLVWICINILMILPILAVLLCLFETHHDDGFFTYRGLLALSQIVTETVLGCALAEHSRCTLSYPDCRV